MTVVVVAAFDGEQERGEKLQSYRVPGRGQQWRGRWRQWRWRGHVAKGVVLGESAVVVACADGHFFSFFSFLFFPRSTYLKPQIGHNIGFQAPITTRSA